jgi:hypothetical protein
VEVLEQHYGRDVVRELLYQSRLRHRFSRALYATLGMQEEELERFLREQVRRRYGLGFIVGDLSLLWLGIVFLAAVGYGVQKIVRGRALRRMDEEDEEDEEDEGMKEG